jgi:hypothetical protein
VSKKSVQSLGGFSKEENKLLRSYVDNGKITELDDFICLTESGFLFADGIAQDFFRTS